MDRELQTYYENQFDLMSHPGWKDLVDKFKELKAQYNDLSIVPDAQTLYTRQGQLDILNWLLSWKESCETAWKNLQQDAEVDGV
jgi:hypothetical protein